MAAEAGRIVVPHCWKTGIGIAASAAMAAVTPHCAYIEYLPADLCNSSLRKELTVNDELVLQADGTIPLPSRPGLGIELSQKAMELYEVEKR